MSLPTDWRGPVLLAAAAYNLLWGAWVVLFPSHVFTLTGMVQPLYPMMPPQLTVAVRITCTTSSIRSRFLRPGA